jgi:hypothetical protein
MFADNTIVESIVWLAIGFVPTYGAMDLAWKIVKRRMEDKNRRRTAAVQENSIISNTCCERN